MVWFQCEDCGESLKKPKLPNHFQRCSAWKLSCIDCGVVFDRQSVLLHTSCVTEAEKYGPKGVPDASGQKPKTGSMPSCEESVKRGLSTKAPWSCSLCKITVSSEQTLQMHSEGKRHMRIFRAALGNGAVMAASKDLTGRSPKTNAPAVDATKVSEVSPSVLPGDETERDLGFQSNEDAVEGEQESGKNCKKKKETTLKEENHGQNGEADNGTKDSGAHLGNKKAGKQSKAGKVKSSKKENDPQSTGVDPTESDGKKQSGKTSKKRKEHSNGAGDQNCKDPSKDPVLGGQKKKKRKTLEVEKDRGNGVADKAVKDGSSGLGDDKSEQQSQADEVQARKEKDRVQAKGTNVVLDSREKKKKLKVKNEKEVGPVGKAIEESSGSLGDLKPERSSNAVKLETIKTDIGKKEVGKISNKRKEHGSSADDDAKGPLKDHQGVKKKKNKLQE